MKSLPAYVKGLRRRCASIIDPDSVPLRKALSSAYYSQQISCAVPNLWFLLAKFLGERETGWFVEVGAFDGKTASNTWGLASRGWAGLLVEPIAEHARSCQRNHHQHSNVQVVQQAIGAPGVKSVQFELARTLTTGNRELAEEYRQLKWARWNMSGRLLDVPSTTLDELLASKGVPHNFDCLSVDVEGFEAQVFAGFNLGYWRPRVMIIELVETHSDLNSTARTDAKLFAKINRSGYIVAYKDSINTVFVREDIWMKAYDLHPERHDQGVD